MSGGCWEGGLQRCRPRAQIDASQHSRPSHLSHPSHRSHRSHPSHTPPEIYLSHCSSNALSTRRRAPTPHSQGSYVRAANVSIPPHPPPPSLPPPLPALAAPQTVAVHLRCRSLKPQCPPGNGGCRIPASSESRGPLDYRICDTCDANGQCRGGRVLGVLTVRTYSDKLHSAFNQVPGMNTKLESTLQGWLQATRTAKGVHCTKQG